MTLAYWWQLLSLRFNGTLSNETASGIIFRCSETVIRIELYYETALNRFSLCGRKGNKEWLAWAHVMTLAYWWQLLSLRFNGSMSNETSSGIIFRCSETVIRIELHYETALNRFSLCGRKGNKEWLAWAHIMTLAYWWQLLSWRFNGTMSNETASGIIHRWSETVIRIELYYETVWTPQLWCHGCLVQLTVLLNI